MRPPVARVIRACAIPCVVLGAALFAVLAVRGLPVARGKLDLAGAAAATRGQHWVSIIAIHAAFVFAGLLAPFARGDGAWRATRTAALALPSIWIHVVAAQLLVAIALVAGVVPGLLALGPAAFIAAVVAGGDRGGTAFDAAAAAAAPGRWQLAGLVLAYVVVEVGATLALRELLVPELSKKTPPAGLVAAYRFAWINAARAAAMAPIIGAIFAALHARFSHRDPPRA